MDENKEKKYKEALATLSKTPEGRQALAEMIVEYVDVNHYPAELIGTILNTRTLKPGDQLFKRLRKGITVRTLVPGAIHLSNEITVEDRAWYNLSGVDVKVTANQWDLDSGQIGTMADIESEMRAKLTDYYIGRIGTALTTLWTAANTPNNYVSVGGQLTAAALETAIDWINYRVGAVQAVLGTRRALTPITKFGQYTPYAGAPAVWGVPVPSAIEEVRKTGFVGTYYGCNIIALDQIWSDPKNMTPLFPATAVIVIGKNVGEFITYGDVMTKAWTDMNPTPPNFITEIYQQYGMIIWEQEGIYLIADLTP